MYTAGQGFNLTGPYPGAPTMKPTTPEEARKGVQAHKALKVDFIKLWMGDKGFTPDVVEAIVDEAKKQNIPVVAHIGNAAQVKQLADLGVTDFMHEARDGMNPEFIAYAKSKGLSFAPTLGQGQSRWYYYEHPEILAMDPKFDGFYARGRAMLNDPARRQEIMGAADFAEQKQRFKDNNYPFIKMMSDAGIRIVTGTDCGAEASQTTPVGHTTHQEVQMFVEAGMTPANALRAATLDAARVLERTENPSYGSIQAGKIADLVVLNADPIADINNTIKIDRVMRAGQMGSITVRPDIYEKHRSLFGDKTVNGRRVNVDEADRAADARHEGRVPRAAERAARASGSGGPPRAQLYLPGARHEDQRRRRQHARPCATSARGCSTDSSAARRRTPGA